MQVIKFIFGNVMAGILTGQATVLVLNREVYTLVCSPCFCFAEEHRGENRNGTSVPKHASGLPAAQHCSLMAAKAAVTEVSCSWVIWGLYLMRLTSILQAKQSKVVKLGGKCAVHQALLKRYWRATGESPA